MSSRIMPVILFTLVLGSACLIGEWLYDMIPHSNLQLHHAITATITQLHAAEARWNTAILTMQLQGSNHDDALGEHIATQRNLEQRLAILLHDAAPDNTPVQALMQIYQRTMQKKLALAESFTSRHAILHTSMTYIAPGIRTLNDQIQPSKARSATTARVLYLLKQDVQDLAVTLLAYNTPSQSSGSEAAHAALERLKPYIDDTKLPEALRHSVETVAHHAETIVTQHPEVHRLLTGIVSHPTADALQQVQTAYTSVYDDGLTARRSSRFILLSYVALLVVALTYTVLRYTHKHRVRRSTAVNEALKERAELAEALRQACAELQCLQIHFMPSEKMPILEQTNVAYMDKGL